jgi:hypothetical protein
MAEAFPVSGNIEPASFPHLLVDLHRHAATGSLKVTDAAHPTKALYFRSGRILFGSSKDPQDHLGAILIESGRITREQFDEVNARMGPGNPLAKVLAESGLVKQRELAEAARTKVERILADVLSWESGSFEFEDGVLPKGWDAIDLKLATERLLLAAVQRIADRGFALRHVDMETVLQPAPEGEAALAEVRAEVWSLLERLDGQRTLKDAIALTRLDEFEAAKTACAMLFLGIVRKSAGGKEVDLAEEAQSGFSAEASPRTPPGGPPAPAADLGGFALAEPEAPSFPAIEPEPTVASAAETMAFAFASGEAEPAPFVTPEHQTDPFPEVVPAEPAVLPEAPSFATDLPWARKPPPSEEPAAPAPAPSFPEVTPPPAPASRPTREDLAALDALLSPSASGRLARSPVERARPEKWEPPSRPPTTPPRRAPARSGSVSRARSRVPVIAIVLGAILVTTVVAWYFLLRTPDEVASATPGPPPVTEPKAPTPAPSAIATVEPTPLPASTATPTAAPVATPTPTPTPATRPTPTPRAEPPAPAGDARALLTRGALPDAARAFAASMAPDARGRFSLQVLVACDPENIQKALTAVPAAELFILPVNVKGRGCYRLCWSVYESRPAAEAALSSLPSYFRQGGAVPRLSPLAELLP